MVIVKAINLEQAKILKMKWARQMRVLELIYNLPEDMDDFEAIEDFDNEVSK